MYIKSELYKVVKSTRSIIFIVVIFLIPFIDLIMNICSVYLDYWLNTEVYIDGIAKSSIYHPVVGSFLSGISEGHIAQMLLIWFLPIYSMLIVGDSYIREFGCGYNNIIFTIEDRKNIVKGKIIVSFFVMFIVSLVSMMVNFCISQIVFLNGNNMLGLEGLGVVNGFVRKCLQHPNIAYVMYILMYSIIAGGCGILCSCVSFIIPDNRIAYPVVFFAWILQIISPYSLTYLTQPFIEYGPEYFLPALLIFVVIIAVAWNIAYISKVKKDEI